MASKVRSRIPRLRWTSVTIIVRCTVPSASMSTVSSSSTRISSGRVSTVLVANPIGLPPIAIV